MLSIILAIFLQTAPELAYCNHLAKEDCCSVSYSCWGQEPFMFTFMDNITGPLINQPSPEERIMVPFTRLYFQEYSSDYCAGDCAVSHHSTPLGCQNESHFLSAAYTMPRDFGSEIYCSFEYTIYFPIKGSLDWDWDNDVDLKDWAALSNDLSNWGD